MLRDGTCTMCDGREPTLHLNGRLSANATKCEEVCNDRKELMPMKPAAFALLQRTAVVKIT